MFPPEVRQFIGGAVRSLWALELLLLLHRRPDSAWSVEALTVELRASNGIVGEILETFDRAGLIEKLPDATWRYAPGTAELRGIVDQIAAAYATTPLAVSREIFASADAKIRSLAEAFRLKKDPS